MIYMSILWGLIVTTTAQHAALLLRACWARSARVLCVNVVGRLSVVWCECWEYCVWLKWLMGDRHAHAMIASGRLVGWPQNSPTLWARLKPSVALANAITRSVNPLLQSERWVEKRREEEPQKQCHTLIHVHSVLDQGPDFQKHSYHVVNFSP